ncbi:hypothetical protein [Prochlorococcus marinus]|uniref:hypothetical protein n=1 Tax=Prochlorococcus TaxID=1218 RepID=UPI0012DA660E|nr:hypothetical protein [Prochlorococcus marinus]
MNNGFLSSDSSHLNITTELSDQVEIICCSTISEILPYIFNYLHKYRYLIWCDEPLWLGLDGFDIMSYVSELRQIYSVQIAVVTHINCDFSWQIHAFLSNYYFPSLFSAPSLDSLHSKKDKAIFLGQYRQEPVFKYNLPNNKSICTIRCSLAIKLWLQNLCDILGKGWSKSFLFSKPTRDLDSWVSTKLQILRSYKYNICSENSAAPSYITEKILHSVFMKCIPIYHFNYIPTNDFSQNLLTGLRNISIDASNHSSRSISDILSSMTDSDYIERCYTASKCLDLARSNCLDLHSISRIVATQIHDQISKQL